MGVGGKAVTIPCPWEIFFHGGHQDGAEVPSLQNFLWKPLSEVMELLLQVEEKESNFHRPRRMTVKVGVQRRYIHITIVDILLWVLTLYDLRFKSTSPMVRTNFLSRYQTSAYYTLYCFPRWSTAQVLSVPGWTINVLLYGTILRLDRVSHICCGRRWWSPFPPVLMVFWSDGDSHWFNDQADDVRGYLLANTKHHVL